MKVPRPRLTPGRPLHPLSVLYPWSFGRPLQPQLHHVFLSFLYQQIAESFSCRSTQVIGIPRSLSAKLTSSLLGTVMSSARRCACTAMSHTSSDLPNPLKLQTITHKFDNHPLTLAMRSDGKAEQQASPTPSLSFPSFSSPQSDTRYIYDIFHFSLHPYISPSLAIAPLDGHISTTTPYVFSCVG